MSGMEPYSPPSNLRLTAGARFIRGFQRIGLICATVVFLAGISIAAIIITNDINSQNRGRTQAKCIIDKAWSGGRLVMNSLRQNEVQFDDSGCPGPGYSDTMTDIKNRANLPPVSIINSVDKVLIGLVAATSAALTSFLVFALLGWVCAGFTRD